MDSYFKDLQVPANIKSLYYKGKLYNKKELTEKVQKIHKKYSDID